MLTINKSFIDQLRFNADGLIPAIAQDWLDGTILMMAWMNKQSLNQTIDTGKAHYWSRSRNQLWLKGETSGNFQIVKNLLFDCDKDVILLTIQQEGSAACHTGERSCFFREPKETTLGDTNFTSFLPPSNACSDLFKTIKQRESIPEPGSYTNKLLEGGDNLILKKIGEESAEFIMACKDKDLKSISNEAADVIFHLQVALANHEVSWEDVLEILVERRGAPRRD